MRLSHIELAPETASVIAWVASLGAVTADALACHRRLSIASARGRLSSAERAGALRRWQPLSGRPALYTITAAGLRSIGLPGARAGRISASTAAHAIACSEVAVALGRLYPHGTVAGEPEIGARIPANPLPG